MGESEGDGIGKHLQAETQTRDVRSTTAIYVGILPMKLSVLTVILYFTYLCMYSKILYSTNFNIKTNTFLEYVYTRA